MNWMGPWLTVNFSLNTSRKQKALMVIVKGKSTDITMELLKNKQISNKTSNYCWIIKFHSGSIFMEFVGTSQPQINILQELLN